MSENLNHQEIINRLSHSIRDDQALIESKRETLGRLQELDKLNQQIDIASERLVYLESKAEAAKLEQQQAQDYPEKSVSLAGEAGVVYRKAQKTIGISADNIKRAYLRSRGWNPTQGNLWASQSGSTNLGLDFAFLEQIDHDLSGIEPVVMGNLEHRGRILRGEVAATK
jgi:hypothetical protein